MENVSNKIVIGKNDQLSVRLRVQEEEAAAHVSVACTPKDSVPADTENNKNMTQLLPSLTSDSSVSSNRNLKIQIPQGKTISVLCVRNANIFSLQAIVMQSAFFNLKAPNRMTASFSTTKISSSFSRA